VISGLAISATVLSGWLAGLSLDRMVVALPAWRRVGLRDWAKFSRHSDLGNGRAPLPLLGLAAPGCSVAAAVLFQVGSSAPRAALVPLYASAVLGIAHVLATARAAPNMLQAARLDEDDLAALARAFAGFRRWHAVRAVLQAMALARAFGRWWP
jgi:hypothetical protein